MPTSRIKRSAELLGQSWAVLRGDPSLAVFPVVSGIATLALAASFIVPVAMDEQLQASLFPKVPAAEGGKPGFTASPTAIVLFFLFYVSTTFVIIFFNVALLGAADRKFRGQPTGVAAGLAVATSRLPQILAWTVVSALIGTLINMVTRRDNFVSRALRGVLGTSWAVATYFVLPALVIDGCGPFQAIRRSVAAIGKSWGEVLALAVGFGAVSVIVAIVSLGLVAAGFFSAMAMESLAMTVTLAALGVLTLLAWIVIAATLRAITQMALYRFAVDGQVPNGFDRDTMEAAFAKTP